MNSQWNPNVSWLNRPSPRLIFAHRASKRPAPRRTTSVVWSCWWRRFGWRRRAEPELKDGWKMFCLFSKNIGLHLKTFGITGNWYDFFVGIYMGFTAIGFTINSHGMWISPEKNQHHQGKSYWVFHHGICWFGGIFSINIEHGKSMLTKKLNSTFSFHVAQCVSWLNGDMIYWYLLV